MPPSRRRRRLNGLEIATLGHVGVFLAATTWAFGGNADWVKTPLSALGSLSVLITLAAIFADRNRFPVNLRLLQWLWPFALFNLMVVISLFNPSFREIKSGPDSLLVLNEVSPWLPTAGLPGNVLAVLWLFDGIYLSCFNLALVIQTRRALRGLLVFAVGNALVLAVFGTVQKLSGAKGLFFGLVKSPQTYFFSSFIYHNHWGSFIVLMSAACLGLTWRYALRHSGRDIFHTPAFGGLVTLFFLAITVPLSTSRSCTLLLLLLLSGSFVHWTMRVARRRQTSHESAAGPLIGACAAIALAAAAIWMLDREVISKRIANTEQQLADMRERGDMGARAVLYRDTWRMAADKPWFGWGTASYPYVFTLYCTIRPNRLDRLPVFYHDAHSDWLQSAAEHGVIGTILLGLCGLVPALGLLRHRPVSHLPLYLLAGCTLVLLYAWIEFPFGNVAVVLSWWLCFFCAVCYARLHRVETEEGSRAQS